jgi:acyl-coenzyme A thioesterase PaaI-like protein
VHFLRPITSDLGPIRAIGTVLNRGRRTALGRAEVRDGAQRLLAHATASCMLIPADA